MAFDNYNRRAHRLQPRPLPEYVPFDSPDQTYTPIIPSGSTITGEEQKIFEQLAQLQKEPPSSPEGPQPPIRYIFQESDLDRLLDKAIDRASDEETWFESRIIAEDSVKLEDISKTPASFQAPTGAEFKDVVRQIRRANTDVELWRIMEEELFKPVKALRLDEPAVKKPSQAVSAEPQVLLRNFPGLLIFAARILKNTYPTSPLILSIFPKLRQLGPSAFALGATPSLYHVVLSVLHEQYYDFAGMSHLLAEMQREFIEYHDDTLHLVVDAAKASMDDEEGARGSAVQALWQMPHPWKNGRYAMHKEYDRLRDMWKRQAIDRGRMRQRLTDAEPTEQDTAAAAGFQDSPT
ncbi:hypothetical protein H2203_005447 [Taxawa tesnikishii (nom. ined.)]|nr:hypothetical protein H2203_005447 [Dothideales sp. JES 119]